MKSRKKKDGAILLAEGQMQHVGELIDSALLSGGKTPDFIETLRMLKTEMDRADIIPEQDVPDDVVQIGCYLEVEDRADGSIERFQLVYPEYSDLAMGRISLMTPMGIAVVGRHQGEEVSYNAPSGLHTVHILRVDSTPPESFQPMGLRDEETKEELE